MYLALRKNVTKQKKPVKYCIKYESNAGSVFCCNSIY